jgi:hypothetical protein
MMKTTKTMMAVAALALPIGDVQAKAPADGKLVVYRASGIGLAVKESFILDGQPHNIGYNHSREFNLPAGRHTVCPKCLSTSCCRYQGGIL